MQNSAVDGLAAVQALKPADNAADLQFKTAICAGPTELSTHHECP
jgi:hypothetical protein